MDISYKCICTSTHESRDGFSYRPYMYIFGEGSSIMYVSNEHKNKIKNFFFSLHSDG